MNEHFNKGNLTVFFRSFGIFFFFLYTTFPLLISAQNCKGLVNAGPDLFTCDPTMMVQLQGAINGNPTKYEWTPTVGLSNTKVLDPMVTIKTPGRYKFKLSAEVVGNINLVVNGNFEGGFSGFSTEYAFKTLGQGFGPNDVAIATNPKDYNSGFQTCGDHTSGGGNMWLVDGSTQAGKKVWCQTVAVIPGNSYQFELYSMNVFPVSPSILDISVNGTSIGGGQVGGLCDWALMMACFKATSASANICISELSGVGYGNDFALDDIALYEKCLDEDEVEVEIVDLIAKLVIPVKPKCTSDIFDLFATGSSGGPDITYEWSTDKGTIISQNGLIAQGRGSGKYTIKVKYDRGNTHCEKEANIDFEAPDKLEGSILSKGLANCGLDSVSLNINMTSGSGNYTFNWNPAKDILKGSNTETILVTKPQKYKVTVTDQNTGCKLELDKDIMADTAVPRFTLIGDTLINCIAKSINLNATLKDTSIYNFVWTLPDNQKIIQNSKINSNQSGNYLLKIQNKNNKCSDSLSWKVNIDTSKPQIQLNADLFIDCINNFSTIVPNSQGSKSDLKYFWILPSGQIFIEDSLFIKTSSTGGYAILRTLNQRNGCFDIDSILIKDIRKFPNLSLPNVDTLNCAKKSVNLISSSGNSDSLKFSWTTKNGNITKGSNDSIAVVDSKGIYYITVEDTLNHCKLIDSLEVFENINKPSAKLGPDLIFKCSDTLVTIDGTQSSSGNNFSYDWKTTNGSISSGLGTNKIIVNSSGQYIMIVTDITNFCMDTATILVKNDINKPTVIISPSNKLTCSITQLTLNAIGNSTTGAALSYNWKSDKLQAIQNNTKSNPTITEPGIYSVEVTDQSNGCSGIAQIVIDIDTVSPIADAGLNKTLNCAITLLDLNASNSSFGPEYNYTWTSVNGKIITTNDPKVIETTIPGNYIIKVFNTINGCSRVDEVVVNIDTTRPKVMIVVPDSLTCLVNSITLKSNGSSTGQNYQYLWSTQNGNILDPLTLNNIKVNKKGTYTFEVKDTLNKCSASQTIEVFEDVNIPNISISLPTVLTCKIRSIILQLNILNDINSKIQWTSTNGNIVSGGTSLSPVINKEGWYYVKVINTNGCSTVDSVLIAEIKNVPTSLEVDLNQPMCEGDDAILQNLNVTGGVGPFTYELDGSSVKNFPINNLSVGIHQLKAIDKNGCEVISNFTIDKPSQIQISLPPDAQIDEGASYVLNLKTSIPQDSIESIKWEPSINLSCDDCLNPTILNLKDDTVYTITVINKNGCIATATIRIKIIKRGIWTPNVFSPNSDGINDYFYPYAISNSYKNIKLLKIYDRWGALIFSKENFQANLEKEGWDGNFNSQPVNPGVFIYYLIIEWNSGETSQLQGEFTLIR